MKTKILILFIFLFQITFGFCQNDSISKFKPYIDKDQIYWDLKNDAIYNLEIIENNIDSFPERFYFTEKDKNIKISKEPIFLYKNCKIVIHPITKDTFQMNIISEDYKEIYDNIKGLLFQEYFSSKERLSGGYVTDDLKIIYSIFVDPIFNYKSSLGILRLDIDNFDSFYYSNISTILTGGEYDSLDNYIPDESLKLYKIDTLDNDIIARFKGKFHKGLNGEIDNGKKKSKKSNRKLDLDMYFSIDLDYSLKNKQSVNSISEIYLFSEGTIKTKKRIFIKIFKIV